MFHGTLNSILDKVAPPKNVKILGHKIWHDPWITKGISKSMNKCLKLYKTLLKKKQLFNHLHLIKTIEILKSNIKPRKIITSHGVMT